MSLLAMDLHSKQILLRGNLDKGLYKAIANSTLTDAMAAPPVSFLSHSTNTSKLTSLWHNRLGHPAFLIVNKVLQHCNQKSFPLSSFEFCNSCQFGKSHRLPFTQSTSRAQLPFELVHTDLWGASPIISVTGMKYFILFVDDYSRFSWIYFLKVKSDAFPTFLKFKALVETQFNAKIKAIQTDGGGEYAPFTPFLTNLGIFHRLSCPITSEQNGRVERKHRHVVELGLSTMSLASVPFKYWTYAFHTAVYLINRLPTVIHSYKSPFELLYNKLPSYSLLKVFGCSCFPCLRPYNKHKLEYRSQECIFLGYSSQHKGYICLSKATGRIYI